MKSADNIDKMRGYFPVKDAEFVVWYGNFTKKCADYQSRFASVLTPAAINQINNNYSAISATISYINSCRHRFAAIAEYKRILFDGEPGENLPDPLAALPALSVPVGSIASIKSWTRQIVRQLKAHPAYSESVGEALGIIAPRRQLTDPTVTIRKVILGQVELRIGLGNRRVAIVEGRRNGSAWETIGYASQMRFIDERPNMTSGLPEYREYRVTGILQNRPSGQPSDIVGVSTLP